MKHQEIEHAIICNRCDVSVQVDKRNDLEERVYCPVCGADFGSRRDVLAKLPAKHFEAYRDRESWRIAR